MAAEEGDLDAALTVVGGHFDDRSDDRGCRDLLHAAWSVARFVSGLDLLPDHGLDSIKTAPDLIGLLRTTLARAA